MPRGHVKTFYILLNNGNYCKVEAAVQADVEIYADAYFREDWDRVLSSGQWWEYKNSKKASNARKEQQNVN